MTERTTAFPHLRTLHSRDELQEAVAAERERCAKICDDVERSHRTTRKSEGAMLCAAAIRRAASDRTGLAND